MSNAVASCEESWLHRVYTEYVRYSLKWHDPVTGMIYDTPRQGRLALDLGDGEQSRKHLEETFWRAGWWTLQDALKQTMLDERAASIHKTRAALQGFRHCLERALALTISPLTVDLGTTKQPGGAQARVHNRETVVPGSSHQPTREVREPYTGGSAGSYVYDASPTRQADYPGASSARKEFHISNLTPPICRALIDEFLRTQNQSQCMWHFAVDVDLQTSMLTRYKLSSERSVVTRNLRETHCPT